MLGFRDLRRKMSGVKGGCLGLGECVMYLSIFLKKERMNERGLGCAELVQNYGVEPFALSFICVSVISIVFLKSMSSKPVDNLPGSHSLTYSVNDL